MIINFASKLYSLYRLADIHLGPQSSFKDIVLMIHYGSGSNKPLKSYMFTKSPKKIYIFLSLRKYANTINIPKIFFKPNKSRNCANHVPMMSYSHMKGGGFSHGLSFHVNHLILK